MGVAYENKGFDTVIDPETTGTNEHNGDNNTGHTRTDQTPQGKPSEQPPGSDHLPSPFRRPVSFLQRALAGSKPGVHLLVCLFGISAWADMNGMWSELPVLVLQAPEAWNLPSYVIIISQIANIGPLVFVLATILISNRKGKLEKVTSMAIILSDVLAVVLLSFYWDRTSHVMGRERSTALLALNFVFALGDCTSSLAFYSFMSSLKPVYMASLFLGEGLSGMVPAFIALAQGVSDIDCVTGTNVINATLPNGTGYEATESYTYPKFGAPGFSVQVYFLIIAGILVISAVAFILLNTLHYCESETVEPDQYTASENKPEEHSRDNHFTEAISTIESQDFKLKDNTTNQEQSFRSPDKKVDGIFSGKSTLNLKKFFTVPGLSGREFFIYMAITAVINMTLTTFLASVQSYSTLPYGLEPYHLATNLSQIANPVACFLALFVMTTRTSIIAIFFALGQVGVACIVYAVATSPTPPLHGEAGGKVLTVSLWVAVTFLLVYAKVCVAGVMRRSGRRALLWFGAVTQAGCFVGAITAFLLVNQYEVFTSAPYC